MNVATVTIQVAGYTKWKFPIEIGYVDQDTASEIREAALEEGYIMFSSVPTPENFELKVVKVNLG